MFTEADGGRLQRPDGNSWAVQVVKARAHKPLIPEDHVGPLALPIEEFGALFERFRPSTPLDASDPPGRWRSQTSPDALTERLNVPPVPNERPWRTMFLHPLPKE